MCRSSRKWNKIKKKKFSKSIFIGMHVYDNDTKVGNTAPVIFKLSHTSTARVTTHMLAISAKRMWSWYHSWKLSRNFSLGYVSETCVVTSDFDVISVNEREDSLYRLDTFIYTYVFALSFTLQHNGENFISEEKDYVCLYNNNSRSLNLAEILHLYFKK